MIIQLTSLKSLVDFAFVLESSTDGSVCALLDLKRDDRSNKSGRIINNQLQCVSIRAKAALFVFESRRVVSGYQF